MSYSFNSRIATCSSEHWMVNSLGQSPCQVATALGGKPCGIEDFILAPLSPSSSTYGSPSPSHLNRCQCNVIIYNLINACALCQSGKIIDWTTYINPCVSSVGTWGIRPPVDIPEGIAVPAWAFSGRPNADYKFSIEAAKRATGPDVTSEGSQIPDFGNGNQSSPTRGPPFGGANTVTEVNTVLDPAPPPADAAASGFPQTSSDADATANGSSGQGSRGSNANIGLILGVAVGSAIALVVIVCITLLWRRKRLKKAPQDMAAAETSFGSTSLQHFLTPYGAPHSSGGHLASQADAFQTSESPPAYTAEDSGPQDAAPVAQPHLCDQSKFRNFREPIPIALPVHKESLRQ